MFWLGLLVFLGGCVVIGRYNYRHALSTARRLQQLYPRS
jgi:hypothetical protein